MNNAERILEFEYFVNHFSPQCISDEYNKELCTAVLRMLKKYYTTIEIEHSSENDYHRTINCPQCGQEILLILHREKPHGFSATLDPPEIVDPDT